MTEPATSFPNPGSTEKDVLVKALATLFLNPADRDRTGKMIFVQNYLGCGCPDDVVQQAEVRFFTRPLGRLLERRIARTGPSRACTLLEQETNRLIQLPKTLKWPRRRSGELVPPGSWRLPMLRAAARTAKQLEKLLLLRRMSGVVIDAVIEVPDRAFFFLVVQGSKRLRKDDLLVRYQSGQLLYQLRGYNRCRLFTITREDSPKIIPQIDTALTWKGLHEAIVRTEGRYPFAHIVSDLFQGS